MRTEAQIRALRDEVKRQIKEDGYWFVSSSVKGSLRMLDWVLDEETKDSNSEAVEPKPHGERQAADGGR